MGDALEVCCAAAGRRVQGQVRLFGLGRRVSGVGRLQPIKVLAWTTLYVDATRFLFEAGD